MAKRKRSTTDLDLDAVLVGEPSNAKRIHTSEKKECPDWTRKIVTAIVDHVPDSARIDIPDDENDNHLGNKSNHDPPGKQELSADGQNDDIGVESDDDNAKEEQHDQQQPSLLAKAGMTVMILMMTIKKIKIIKIETIRRILASISSIFVITLTVDEIGGSVAIAAEIMEYI
jgi:hypothetical protein